ncbi:MAG: hypothetical protein JW863_08595 [Chitinispirillaceae bacterium]|nr:hypothetical protein [Chitinispirillaceae bacterium]
MIHPEHNADIDVNAGKPFLNNVGKVMALIVEIAAASAEQAQGIDQVNKAVA